MSTSEERASSALGKISAALRAVQQLNQRAEKVPRSRHKLERQHTISPISLQPVSRTKSSPISRTKSIPIPHTPPSPHLPIGRSASDHLVRQFEDHGVRRGSNSLERSDSMSGYRTMPRATGTLSPNTGQFSSYISSSGGTRHGSLKNSRSNLQGFSYLQEILADHALGENGDTSHYDSRVNHISEAFNRSEMTVFVDFFNKAFQNAMDDDKPKQRFFPMSIERSESMTMLREETSSTHVVVFGSICMDLLTESTSFPVENSHQKGNNLTLMPGGKGANEAVACGRLDVYSYLIGRVGCEDHGREIILNAVNDVDVQGVEFDEDNPTGLCMIVKSGRLKTTTTCPSANMSIGDRETTFLKKVLHSDPDVRVVVLDTNINMEAAVEAATIARERGVPVFLRPVGVTPNDVGGAPCANGGLPDTLLENSDVIICNEYEAPVLAGVGGANEDEALAGISIPLKNLVQASRIGDYLLITHHHLLAVIVVTMSGAVVCVRRQSNADMVRQVYGLSEMKPYTGGPIGMTHDTFAVPLQTPTVIVDVVGAADAFLGAIVAGLSHHAPLYHAIVWGTCASNLSVQRAGAQPSFARLNEFQEFTHKMGLGIATPQTATVKTRTIERWPTCKPQISERMVKLEEMLHKGRSDEFVRGMADLGRDEIDQAVDFQGQTLLHLAVMFTELSAVCAILRRSPDLTVKDRYGQTAVQRSYSLTGNKGTKFADVQIDPASLIKLCLETAFKIQQTFMDSDSIEVANPRPPVPTITINPDTRPPSPLMSDDNADDTYITIESTEFESATPTPTPHENDASSSTNADDTSWPTLLLIMQTLTWQFMREIMSEKDNVGVIPDFKHITDLSTRLLSQVLEFCESCGDEKADSIIDKMARTRLDNQVGLLHGTAYGASLPVFTSLATLMWRRQTALDIIAKRHLDCQNPIADGDRVVISEWFQQYDCANKDQFGRGTLHFAVLSGNVEKIKHLLQWGLNPSMEDNQGNTPLDYAPNQAVVEQIKQHGSLFVSVGHSPETDKVVNFLVQGIMDCDNGVWWDQTGIQEGNNWRNEITSALFKSNAFVLILTQKWVHSPYCLAEARMAVNENKPIFILKPPVPVDQQATMKDLDDKLKDESALFAAISRRQCFDFSDIPQDLDSVKKAARTLCQTIGQNLDEPSIMPNHSILEGVMGSSLSKPIIPNRVRPSFGKDDYVLVISGSPGAYLRTSFMQILVQSIFESHIPVARARKPNAEEMSGAEYWTALDASVARASSIVVLLDDASDQGFLTKVIANLAKNQKRALVVPHSQLNLSGQGFYYSANFTPHDTCCFTDWSGQPNGFNPESEVFQQIFKQHFLALIDPSGTASATSVGSVGSPWSATSAATRNSKMRMSSLDAVLNANTPNTARPLTVSRDASPPPGRSQYRRASSDGLGLPEITHKDSDLPRSTISAPLKPLVTPSQVTSSQVYERIGERSHSSSSIERISERSHSSSSIFENAFSNRMAVQLNSTNEAEEESNEKTKEPNEK